jgi:hypothetical protein
MARRGTAASINLAELEKLAAMQCTDEEIAAWFNVSTRTIERRRKSPVFAETICRRQGARPNLTAAGSAQNTGAG